MKKLIVLFGFILFASFASSGQTRQLENGHYLVVMDPKYKEQDANDYDFTLVDDKFTVKIGGKYEDCKMKWKDYNTFAVIGFTEPTNPPEFFTENDKIYFQIRKIDDKSFYFIQGFLWDKDPIFTGKFIKTD